MTHLAGLLGVGERNDQAKALRSSLGDSPLRTVVLADVNDEPGSDEATALDAGLQDAGL